MESWDSLGGKVGRTNIQISAEPGSNWGPCGRKAEILPTAPAMLRGAVVQLRFVLHFAVPIYYDHIINSS